MVNLYKEKAGRNRTLVINEEERVSIEKEVLRFDQIDNHTNFLNQMIQADLFEVIDKIPDSFAHLIIIDPPYNLNKTFNQRKFSSMSRYEYEAYLESWFSKVCRKLRPDGTLYMCGDWKCSMSQMNVISKELTILNRITWQREKGRGAQNNWKNAMEDIWFAVKNADNYYFNVDSVKMKRRVIAPYKENGMPKDWEDTEDGRFRITYPSNFWDDISIPFWSMPENTDHPTQKPEKLMAKLILASSRPGDIIFDPFAGSGTTCVVAKKLDRNYLGVEIDELYCLWAAKRLRLADENREIQGYVDGFFWERNSLNFQKIQKVTDKTRSILQSMPTLFNGNE